MTKKAESGRDAFKFSLRGITIIASFTTAPAIADDRLNQVPVDGDQERLPTPTLPSFGRFWLNRRRRARTAA